MFSSTFGISFTDNKNQTTKFFIFTKQKLKWVVKIGNKLNTGKKLLKFKDPNS